MPWGLDRVELAVWAKDVVFNDIRTKIVKRKD
jgi:hypothetical protein